MKCLLCNLQFETTITIDDLKYHYSTFHKVDPNNRFLKKLLNKLKNKIMFQKCFRLMKFLQLNTTRKFKVLC